MSNNSEFDSITALFGANAIFIEQMQEQYLRNPNSVDESWRAFFSGLGDTATQPHPVWATDTAAVIGVKSDTAPAPAAATAPAAGSISKEAAFQQTLDSTRAMMLIRAYRHRGHLIADLDPLGLEERSYHPELDPKTYGFTESDYDHPIFINGMLGYETASLREILTVLRKTYCDKIGVEFTHIQYPDQKLWIQQHIENINGTPTLSPEEKREILDNLIEVEAFEEFLQVKYPGVKRFSVQGGDAAIAGLQAAIQTASEVGVEEIVLGMPHRGRMNVLTTVMGKPYAEMFSLFHGNLDFPEWIDSSGDVKYHLGASSDREMGDGRVLHLSLTANPSHLEVVNPVVCGKTRAKQDQKSDKKKDKVMGIQLHGDAAFAGQGSVPETLSLSELRGYRTGGSLHIIINNQIGFTTSPKYSRFTPYPSDVAKMVEAPIFHVNGDDPEAVAYVCKLAARFRQEFKRDVVVDIFCYRKYGHNEGDEPMFTQPLMYKKIKEKISPAQIYATRLINEGIISQEDVDQEFAEFRQFFDEQYDLAKEFKPNKANWLEGLWAGYQKAGRLEEIPDPQTGVSKKILLEAGQGICKYPKTFHINKKLERIIDARRTTIESGTNIDWATAEALAFATLLKEKFRIRLSGQDSGRGTFSQRHSVLTDQETGKRYTPLNHLGGEQGTYEVIDSSLSEMAILGFEYGYSLAEPNALTLWEAQFGDFANGAQVIIDQFIASGEIKWLRMCGLVMLLPHGYEGQGPEHSSARLERFLQLCGEDNMQVVNCTTPANYFHVLRRQLHRKFRKPLVMMTPKSLLRHKLAVSSLEDMQTGTSFCRIYPEKEKLVADTKIRRVVFCTGKVYYDLYEGREAAGIKDVALLRIEQLYPFPRQEVQDVLKRYKNAEVFWCQEEPENMGAWRFIGPRIGEVLDALGRPDLRIGYAGRKEAASPATGYLKVHNREQKELVDTALADISKKRKVV